MYLYTDRVYNHKIDDYINSTIRLKIALGCFDYFFHLMLVTITKYFNYIDLRRMIRVRIYHMQISLYINSNN